MGDPRYRTQWFFELERAFRRERGRPPRRPSHWDCDPDAFGVADSVLGAMGAPTKEELLRYHFTFEMDELSAKVAEWASLEPVDGLRCPVGEENVSLHANSTQALFHVFLSLRETGVRKALQVTPVYFSLPDSCEVLGIETEFLPTRLANGGLPDVEELLDRVRRGRPEAVVVTHPAYPTGVRWRSRDLTRLWEACVEEGALLVVDASQGGLDWNEDPERSIRGLRADSLDRLVVVQSPAKAQFLNGVRFAHLLGPPDLVENVNENVPIATGAVTFLQARLADAIYTAMLAEVADPCRAKASGGVLHTRAQNVEMVRGRHALLKERASIAGAALCGTDSGILTMIARPDLPMTMENEHRFTRWLLADHGVHMMPGSCTRLMDPENPLAFRLNLTMPFGDLLAGVDAVARIPSGKDLD